ncbi:MAG: metalloprotease TldD [Gammaproteobacteria bacterium]|nr:metalloprotease TldD [Gammaproteobacteria bacterium]
MQNNWSIAKEILLNENELTVEDLSKVIARASSRSMDFADIYLQKSEHESWSLEDGIVKKGSFSVGAGAGIRVVSGAKCGLAHIDNINLDGLLAVAKDARAIASSGRGTISKLTAIRKTTLLYPSINPLDSLTDNDKVLLLQSMDQEARDLDSSIEQVMVHLSGSHSIILVANSDGTLACDVRPQISLRITVIVQDGSRREIGSAGGGGRCDYASFFTRDLCSLYVKEAIRIAKLNLIATEAPAGIMPVVLGNGWAGVLLHEAVGHGLEGDFNRRQSSVYTGKIGEQVASSCCTIVDSGIIPEKRGSLNIDDEGTKTQETVLIENGVLKNYMLDKMNAKLLGMESTGNGRRSSFSSLVVPRMTNTFMRPGKYSQDEIINSVDKGIYAVNFSGGQVDITSGKFVFNTSEAYLIEKGKITNPVKRVAMIGDGPSVLQKISMVGNDLAFDPGIGSCGKEGQSIAVGVGQPTLKVNEMVVGGGNCA